MNKKRLVIAAVFVLSAAASIFVLSLSRTFYVKPNLSLSSGLKPISQSALSDLRGAKDPFSGISCDGSLIRPVAVMLSEDEVARPLSGVAAARLVIEMPVVTEGIDRLMAVFPCDDDVTVGSIRSARDDYIPLASSFDAIYAHWGGSHFALDELNRRVIDNINALSNPYGAFYRTRDIAAPHNGFSSMGRLLSSAKKLGYRVTPSGFISYPHQDNGSYLNAPSDIRIEYPAKVVWKFDEKAGMFLRWRSGRPETDKNSGKQVEAGTVVVMRTDIRQIEGQYDDVRVVGSGEAVVYTKSGTVSGKWQKDSSPLNARLRFVDASGNDIPFTPGPLWIEIVDKITVVQ